MLAVQNCYDDQVRAILGAFIVRVLLLARFRFAGGRM